MGAFVLVLALAIATQVGWWVGLQDGVCGVEPLDETGSSVRKSGAAIEYPQANHGTGHRLLPVL
jgi:hypothetical protein